MTSEHRTTTTGGRVGAGWGRPANTPEGNSLARWGGRRLGFPTAISNRHSGEPKLDDLLPHGPGPVTVAFEGSDDRLPLGRLLAILWVRGGLRDVAQLGVRGTVASIGSDPGNDVVLDAPGVSPRHARLSLAGGVWTLSDLGSVNGTWVDGAPVVDALALAPGSEVRLADVTLTFAPRDTWSDSPPQPVAPVANAPAFSGPLFLPPEETALPSGRLLARAAVVLAVCLLAYIMLSTR